MSKTKWRRYDEEEIALIEQIPQNYLGNFDQGYKELAAKLDRTPGAIKQKALMLRKKNHEEGSYSFVMVSHKQKVVDRKVVRDGCPIKVQKSTRTIWQRLRKLLGLG